jgi:hypothetical protein
MLSGPVCEGFLGVSTLLPKPTKNNSKRNFRIDCPSGSSSFSRHDSECRVLTTIVLPTHSVCHRRN